MKDRTGIVKKPLQNTRPAKKLKIPFKISCIHIRL